MSGTKVWLEEKSEQWRKDNLVFHSEVLEEKTEWILSCDAEFINEFLGFRHGINVGLTLNEFLYIARDAISYRRRKGLENNHQQRHLISYDWVMQLNEAGDDIEVVKYGRNKFSGEQRLVLGHSAGIGGHLEWVDQAQDPEARFLKAPRVALTVGSGIRRERLEEILLKAREAGRYVSPEQADEFLAVSSFLGFLCDNEDPKKTGDYHIGLVSAVLLPRGVHGVINDKSNTPLPPTTPEELLEDPKAERWTKILAQFFVDYPGGMKAFVEQHFYAIGQADS